MLRLVIPGHCPSKKNSRPIFRGAGNRPFVGKGKALRQWEEWAALCLRAAMAGREGFRGGEPVHCTLRVYYRGQCPDAFGPAETVYDALQAAGIVENDRDLIPWGHPAIGRVHVDSKEDERVEIELAAGK